MLGCHQLNLDPSHLAGLAAFGGKDHNAGVAFRCGHNRGGRHQNSLFTGINLDPHRGRGPRQDLAALGGLHAKGHPKRLANIAGLRGEFEDLKRKAFVAAGKDGDGFNIVTAIGALKQHLRHIHFDMQL